jgi:hypothetical protein
VVGVHLEDAPDALLLVLRRVEDRAPGREPDWPGPWQVFLSSWSFYKPFPMKR